MEIVKGLRNQLNLEWKKYRPWVYKTVVFHSSVANIKKTVIVSISGLVLFQYLMLIHWIITIKQTLELPFEHSLRHFSKFPEEGDTSEISLQRLWVASSNPMKINLRYSFCLKNMFLNDQLLYLQVLRIGVDKTNDFTMLFSSSLNFRQYSLVDSSTFLMSDRRSPFNVIPNKGP